jgi:hypothetical protein
MNASAAGLSLVAVAAKNLSAKLCVTNSLAMICTLSAVVSICYKAAWLFPVIIVGGGIISLAEQLYVQVRHPPRLFLKRTTTIVRDTAPGLLCSHKCSWRNNVIRQLGGWQGINYQVLYQIQITKKYPTGCPESGYTLR